jgi:predicted nucleic acid-binding protein
MVTTDGKTPIFLDTNVLIRLHVATAQQHADVYQAVERLLQGRAEIWISRQVMREYAAVLTREQPYTTAPLNPQDVASQLRLFETHYRIAEDNARVTAALCTLLETIPLGGKQVHDANIVATMQAYGIGRLFTLNSVDFTRFSGLITAVSLAELLKDDQA